MTHSASPVVSRLGYLALVPFVTGAAFVCVVGGEGQALAAKALNAYAAVVVSFLGGIHWGFGFRESQPTTSRLFIWGVMPSLVACAALWLTGPVALAIHAAMLALCYAVDRRVYPLHGSASWLPLRFRLTVVAVASCLVGAYGARHLL